MSLPVDIRTRDNRTGVLEVGQKEEIGWKR